MSSGFEQDPHSQAGHACPRNFFELTNYAELQAIETAFSFRRTEELAKRGVSGVFDVPHLKVLHRYLFQDVFPWAGEFRVVNISKGSSTFGMAMHLHGALDESLAKLKKEGFLKGLEARDFAARAAFDLGEINASHPFREGNGRTQREFIRQLGVSAGHPLSWAGFTQQEMVDASILSHLQGDESGLAVIVERALFSTREEAGA